MMLLQFLWELLSSRTAIGLYVLVVLGLIVGLVVAVLRADSARVQVVAPAGDKSGKGNGTGGGSGKETPDRKDGESRFFKVGRPSGLRKTTY